MGKLAGCEVDLTPRVVPSSSISLYEDAVFHLEDGVRIAHHGIGFLHLSCLDVLEKYCTLENILINSELSDAELIDIYPEFNLKKSEKDFTEYYPEYNHYFDYADICTKETYNAFKRLSESGDLYCLLGVSPTESNDLVYASSKNIVYQAEKIITGDVNCDGKIDLTDLSELSLALIGDKELTEAQQKAADVDCDGDVRLADLAKFQQFISKQIDSLG